MNKIKIKLLRNGNFPKIQNVGGDAENPNAEISQREEPTLQKTTLN